MEGSKLDDIGVEIIESDVPGIEKATDKPYSDTRLEA